MRSTNVQAEMKRFGFTLAVAFTILGFLPLLKYYRELNFYFTSFALVFFVVAMIAPKWLVPFHKIWIKLGEILGKITSTILLGIIFYCVLTPISFLYKVFSSETGKFDFRPPKNSYWIKRESSFDIERMKRLF